MSREIERIEGAVLHEGVLLYPYRPSALKNLHRWLFGTLYPPAWCRTHGAGDISALALECLVVGDAETRLSLRLRFLDPSGGEELGRQVESGAAALGTLGSAPRQTTFCFGPLAGAVSAAAAPARPGVFKLTIRVENQTPCAGATELDREEARRSTLASCHLVLSLERGEFVSLIDPPEPLRDLAEGCRNAVLWPVLAGTPPCRATLLGAPIILYDYPRIAPTSQGDLFDGTEIDELLTLRVLTLTDEEKQEIAAASPRARALLARTEALGEDERRALHGTLHGEATPDPLRPGAPVRLRPSGRADILDMALEGRIATIQSIEQDLEGRIHVAVTVNDDPGRDLGIHGHRFFLRPEEVEPL